MVYGLGNKIKVHILGKEPVYTEEDLNKIANKYISPLPSCITKERDMDVWLAVYRAFLNAGLSTEKASKETEERVFWYD